jgi:hypothetical protein
MKVSSRRLVIAASSIIGLIQQALAAHVDHIDAYPHEVQYWKRPSEEQSTTATTTDVVIPEAPVYASLVDHSTDWSNFNSLVHPILKTNDADMIPGETNISPATLDADIERFLLFLGSYDLPPSYELATEKDPLWATAAQSDDPATIAGHEDGEMGWLDHLKDASVDITEKDRRMEDVVLHRGSKIMRGAALGTQRVAPEDSLKTDTLVEYEEPSPADETNRQYEHDTSSAKGTAVVELDTE